MTLTIHHNDGSQSRYADTMTQGIAQLIDIYGDDIVITPDWDELGEGRERKLVYETADDMDAAASNNSVLPVAEIVRDR